MKKAFCSIVLMIILTISVDCQSTDNQPLFNFDFEKLINGFPKDLQRYGSLEYAISVDSLIKYRGNYSVSICSADALSGFSAVAFILPQNYEGKRITFSGYIRTQEVIDGWAGLWMRIDPSVGFDNMSNRGITGTTKWSRHEITLAMNPESTTNIVFGGILSGKGKMWIDDLEITIDGVDIRDMEPIPPKVYPADADREFDEGSGISSMALNPQNTENLNLLGLIWGYLKYYHPAVAEGNYNWDYELFRILPYILEVESAEERDGVLACWIKNLGEFGMKEKDQPQDAKMEPDLQWIGSMGLSEKLVELLFNIRNARRSGEHYYISLAPGVGNPQFKNENSYSSMIYPDPGFRLLSLYRYWNIINYYFPYKYLIEEDWKDVLQEFIPEFVNAGDETEYTLAVLKLITRIHDTHASISGNATLNNYLGSRYAPYEITFIENKAVVTGIYQTEPASASVLKIGDVIVSVNQRSIEKIIEEELEITPGSNHPSRLLRISGNLLRTNDEEIVVEYKRNGVTKDLSLETFPESKVGITNRHRREVPHFRLMTPGIGYLYPGTIKNEYLPAIWKELQDTDGLIIDLRCYPSEFIVFSFSEYLMPRSTEFVKFTTGSITEPGYFNFGSPRSVGRDNPNHYKGKIVILVNEITISQAEYTTMAFQKAPGAIVMGSTTAGADGNVSQFSLPGGINTLITGIGVYYPDGGETQRIGIVPDIVVEPTIEGIRKGRDELIERALEIIKSEKNGL